MDSHLQKLQEEVTATMSGLTVEELARRADGKWSAAELLEHLYLSYCGTVKGFERVLREGKPLARKPTLKDRVAATVVVGFGRIPGGVKSPEVARPRGTSMEQINKDILPQIAAMDEIISRCEDRFGKNTRILDHPILGPLTAQQWRRLHFVHGQHHLKQVRELRKR